MARDKGRSLRHRRTSPDQPARKTRSAAAVNASRKRSIYHEPDTDEEVYRDDTESDEEDDFQPQHTEPQRPSKRRKVAQRKQKPAAQSRPINSSQKSTKRHPRAKKKEHLFSHIHSTPVKKEDHEARFKGQSDNRVPAWTSLPIEILRDIFIFASHPIHEQTTTASANVTWLMRAARTCRAFATPALEAYYLSPSLLNNLQPHHLLELMQIPNDKIYIDYRVKVKSLEIDIRRLTYAAHGKKKLDLSALVQELPQLQHLEVLHPVDTPPYRPWKIQPWNYPTTLFDALASTGQRLKSWRWNRDMIPKPELSDMYGYMIQTHTSKAFEHLERLVVCGFDVNDSMEPPSQGESAQVPPGLASSISVLPHLKDLTFVSCDVIFRDFLERLPKRLERLELCNCLEVTSDMLQKYLLDGASQLRELTLHHNAALDLAFLPRLKELCPRLEVLKMNFIYYSERYNYNDAWAMYDQLLAEDAVPSWPSTLRHLELVNLQKITTGAAKNLFISLAGSAAGLPDLRHLIIQAHLNIPWRDRAGFRDHWIELLQRVFLCRDRDPNPHLGSLKQFRLWKAAQANGKALTDTTGKADDTDSEDEPLVRRRLSHVRVTPRKPPADVETFSDSDSDSKPLQRSGMRPRRSARVAESQSASAPEEDGSSDSEPEDDCRNQADLHIQGLCQVVDIRIDNQRPRENQYTEANFLDSEPSGDEDWHEGAELSDEDQYAW